MQNDIKHLIIVIGGIGLCYFGQIVGTWFIAVGKDVIVLPFQVASVIISLIGFCCCAGALLCQLDRYKKK